MADTGNGTKTNRDASMRSGQLEKVLGWIMINIVQDFLATRTGFAFNVQTVSVHHRLPSRQAHAFAVRSLFKWAAFSNHVELIFTPQPGSSGIFTFPSTTFSAGL